VIQPEFLEYISNNSGLKPTMAFDASGASGIDPSQSETMRPDGKVLIFPDHFAFLTTWRSSTSSSRWKILAEFETRMLMNMIGEASKAHRYAIHPASAVGDLAKELNKLKVGSIVTPKALANESSFSFPLSDLIAVTAGGGVARGIRGKSLREAFRSPYFHLVTKDDTYIVSPPMTFAPSEALPRQYQWYSSRWQSKALGLLQLVASKNRNG
jgi:hypothetical protein